MKMKKPKANLYMLIKIEVDDDNFPNDDVIEVGWHLNKFMKICLLMNHGLSKKIEKDLLMK